MAPTRPFAHRIAMATLLATGLALGIPVGALAQDDHGHNHREAGAHVHGASQLNVVLDGGILAIELTSPGADIVGFEHRPGNEQEKEAVHAALRKLRDGSNLFTLSPRAGCKLAHVGINADQHHRHDHDNDHAEFHGTYRFECQNPDALDSLTIGLFEQFDGARKVAVQWITPRGQSRGELTPERNRLHLDR